MAEARQSADSVVITKTVRLVATFVLTFGLFTAFHGTSSVGGGFQGGAIVAATVIAIAFAFGAAQTDAWLRGPRLRWLAASGVFVFLLVAFATLAFGGAVLDVGAVPTAKGAVYAVELIELGIAATVAATVVIVFLALAGGDDSTGGAG